MDKKGDLLSIMSLVILFAAFLCLGIFVIGNQQVIDKNEQCKKCGFSEATDVKYLLDFTIFPVVYKLECDGSHIITLTYSSIYDKFGTESRDWNNPGVNCR